MKFAPYLVIGCMFFLFFIGLAYCENNNTSVVVSPGVPHDISGISSNMTLIWNSSLSIFEPGNVSGGGNFSGSYNDLSDKPANIDEDSTDDLVDSDFGSAGLMKTDGAGSYSTITDNSGNWNNAYTWSNSLYNTIGLKDLTSAEVDQLENIGSSSISAAQWGYLGGMNQGVNSNDDVIFNSTYIQDNGRIWYNQSSENLTIESYENISFVTDTEKEVFDIDYTGVWSSKYQSSARARLVGVQVIGNFWWTRLRLAVVDFDQNNDFNVILNRFIVPKNGIYQISYSVQIEFYIAPLTLASAIYVNGVQSGGFEYNHDSIPFGEMANSGSDILALSKDDYIELFIWQNSIGNVNAPNFIYTNYLAVSKIG